MDKVVTADEVAAMRERWWDNNSAECEASFSVRLSVRSLIDSHEGVRARLERAEGALKEADILLDRVQRGEPHPQEPGPTVNNSDFWRALRQVRLDAALILTGETPDHCPRCLSVWAEHQSQCRVCGMDRVALGAAGEEQSDG